MKPENISGPSLKPIVKPIDKPLTQIRDCVAAEFRKAGFNNIEVLIGKGSDNKDSVLIRRAEIPVSQEEKLKQVLLFPELTDNDCRKICLVTSKSTNTKNEPVIYIASFL